MSTKPDRHTAVFPNELDNRESESALTPELAIEHGERAPAPGPGERPDSFDVDPPEETEDPEEDEVDEEEES